MSSGHGHAGPHTDAVVEEVKKLLASPDIRKYLAKPYRASYSHQVPLTGGSSRDGRIYFIDPDVPLALRPFVLWHERVEKAIRECRKERYARAHTLATAAERLKVEASGKDWGAYKKAVAKPVRINEAKDKHVALPPGFDTGPMRESGYST